MRQFHIEFISLKAKFYSKYLERKVTFRWVAPPGYRDSQASFPVLLMNDGQDYQPMNLEKILSAAYNNVNLRPFLYVGIETNENRMHEYGTASSADYKGRGDKAAQYSKFIIEEFIPFLKKEFKASQHLEDWIYCGMSLGGLSAFDIVYNNPGYFSKVGVFSGSFWWRKKAYIKKDLEDRSRIVLELVKNREAASHLKFWFQCGTQDETADRNNNGCIDAINDTLDLIKELQNKGYSYPGDITYLQVEGGKHDLATWAAIFPDFINWALAKQKVPIKKGAH